MRRTWVGLVGLLTLGVGVTSGVAAPAGAATHRSPTSHLTHRVVMANGRPVEMFRDRSAAATSNLRQILLRGGTTKLVSSTGVPLRLGVFVDQYNEGPSFGTGTDLEFSLSSRDGEGHLWDFTASPRAFLWDPLTGEGSVRASSELAPYGSVHLSVTHQGDATSQTCPSGGTRVIQPVRVQGTAEFDTQTSSWGSIGDTLDRIVFTGTTSVETDSGRVGLKCQGFIGNAGKCNGSYSAIHQRLRGFLEADGATRRDGSPVGEVRFQHQVAVPGFTEAFRLDYAQSTSSPPALTRTGKGAAISIEGADSGLITGSATWTSVGSPKEHKDACVGAKTPYWHATFTNGTTPLTVTFAVGGTYTFPDTTHRVRLYAERDLRKSSTPALG